MGKELWTESVKRNSSGYLETVSLFFNLKINTSLNTKKKKKKPLLCLKEHTSSTTTIMNKK